MTFISAIPSDMPGPHRMPMIHLLKNIVVAGTNLRRVPRHHLSHRYARTVLTRLVAVRKLCMCGFKAKCGRGRG